jgi:precorrin-2 dehydrogenase/sirohydrochlorin ferrochelatase
MAFFPVNLNITGRLCLVVGGGSVALRKIRALLGCGAKVKVISPWVVTDIAQLAEDGQLSLHLRGYRYGDMIGSFLVFAATDSTNVQEQVGREAGERRILLNSVDDPGRCDFQVPAKVRRGELLLTISTGGASPALSKRIREELEKQFGEEYCTVIDLFARIRGVVVCDSVSSAENKKLFQELLLSDIVEAALQSRWARVRDILKQTLPVRVDCDKIVDSVLTAAQEEHAKSDSYRKGCL